MAADYAPALIGPGAEVVARYGGVDAAVDLEGGVGLGEVEGGGVQGALFCEAAFVEGV